MKITNGKIITGIGIIHTVLTLTLSVYQKQFAGFLNNCFLSISGGPLDSPEKMGSLYYENFAAFWCLYFGLFLFPLGLLLDAIEKQNVDIPRQFTWSYLIITLIGVYMIPLSGMTVFFLPHAIYLMVKNRKKR